MPAPEEDLQEGLVPAVSQPVIHAAHPVPRGEMLKGTRATYGLEPRCVEVLHAVSIG